MSKTAEPILLTAELVQRRDDVRTLLGSGYNENSTMARSILRGAMEQLNLGLGEAALYLAKDMESREQDPSIFFAAFVEECEGGRK